MWLIINADDLGLHPAVERAVAAGARDGVITSASLLANGPFLESALKVQGIGTGAHLNLLRGAPISPAGDIPTLLGQGGVFLGSYRALWLRRLKGGLDPAQVELEWDRQIGLLRDSGARITHIDSEKHIHAWPGLMEIALKLARRHGVNWVRRPLEITPRSRLGKAGLRAKLLAHWSKKTPFDKSPRGPDLLWGLADQGEALTAQRFKAYLAMGRVSRARVVEIACHPGLPSAQDPPIPGQWGKLRVPAQWEAEYKTLSGRAWKELLAEPFIRLAHYGMIPGDSL